MKSIEVADFIHSLRRRLLAEHRDCSVGDLAAAKSRYGGLIAAIAALMSPGRSLRPVDCRVDEGGLDEMVPNGRLVGPSEPIGPDYFVAYYIPTYQRPAGRAWLRFSRLSPHCSSWRPPGAGPRCRTGSRHNGWSSS
jgi:hypothetical protein